MIYLYSGTPGSGKSLHTASVIYWTLKRGVPVIANFAINTGKIKGKKKGTVTITVRSLDGTNKKAMIKIKVK